MADDGEKKVSGRPGGGAYAGPNDYLAALSRGRTEGPADDPTKRGSYAVV